MKDFARKAGMLLGRFIAWVGVHAFRSVHKARIKGVRFGQHLEAVMVKRGR